MDAHHLRNETSEVTNSDMQDSATVIGEDTPSIFIAANNDKGSHGSAQIQDMLASVLSTLNNIQSQNAKANKELGAKLMPENQKLVDRLTTNRTITTQNNESNRGYLSVERRNKT